MYIKSIDDIRQEAVFGRRLCQLGIDVNMNGPTAIAKELYSNDKCYELVKPGGREIKYQLNKDKDIAAIAKSIQRHFDYVEATQVPGEYMMAYSILFDCSLDFLYGKINIKSPNAEILDISKKTGLSVNAVKQLMANEVINVDEFLEGAYNYGILDGPNVGTYDPELDDYYLETSTLISKFWSELIESNLFKQLPTDWYRMACALYTSKSVKVVAKDAEKEMNVTPSLETFLSWVNTWEYFHPKEPLFKPCEATWEEIYEKDSELIKQIYKELRHEHFYSAVDKSEDYETVYWGCAGRFERYILDFFHTKAEQWCTNGPLPVYFDASEK